MFLIGFLGFFCDILNKNALCPQLSKSMGMIVPFFEDFCELDCSTFAAHSHEDCLLFGHSLHRFNCFVLGCINYLIDSFLGINFLSIFWRPSSTVTGILATRSRMDISDLNMGLMLSKLRLVPIMVPDDLTKAQIV